MILSDRNIADALDEGDLKIEPIGDFSQQLQPATFDVRLGNEFMVFDHANLTSIDLNDPRDIAQYTTEIQIEEDDEFVLHPGDFALGTTMEWVEIPDDLIALAQGRSSIGRLAVIIHATAGVIDPGYHGQITLELSNLGDVPVSLNPGMRIAQLLFLQLLDPAERPYGVERDSKYQNQSGPVASRVNDDPEVND